MVACGWNVEVSDDNFFPFMYMYISRLSSFDILSCFLLFLRSNLGPGAFDGDCGAENLFIVLFGLVYFPLPGLGKSVSRSKFGQVLAAAFSRSAYHRKTRVSMVICPDF